MRLGYTNKLGIATSYASSIVIDALPPYAIPLTDSKITTKNVTATYDLNFMKVSGDFSSDERLQVHRADCAVKSSQSL